MIEAFIDFETKSEISLSVGISKYSQHPTTDVLCLCYSLDYGVTVLSWVPGDDMPWLLFDHVESGGIVCAFNAAFELHIWANILVPRYGFPPVSLKQWRCTMSEVMAMNLPAKLEHAGAALRVSEIKDKSGHKLMMKMTKPRRHIKADKKRAGYDPNEVLWHNSPEDMNGLIAYCAQDVRAEIAIHHKVPRLNVRELSVYHFDATMNARGLQVDTQLARSALVVWAQYRYRRNSELQRLTNYEVGSVDELAKLKSFLADKECYSDSLTKAIVVDVLAKSDLDPVVRQVLEIRQELGMSSIAKFDKFIECAESDGRVRGAFQYHGASQTGRWAGRLIQPQNLPRGTLDADLVDLMIDAIRMQDLDLILAVSPIPLGQLLSSLLRPLITAAPGKKLVVCDFASVEARALAWAAGEKWLVSAFFKGADVYKEIATEIYSVPVSQVSKSQRQVGKIAILGCGYGMGGNTFRATLAGYGIDASAEFATDVVNAYRKKNPRIKAYWYETEHAAVHTVKTGQPHKAGPFTYRVSGDWLLCRMPAGRDIGYYKPHLAPGKYSQQLRFLAADVSGRAVVNSTYGGCLVENNIQALCRDLMVDGMANLERAGYSVVATVHDEAVSEVHQDLGSAEQMREIMCKVPHWAKGFPLDGEAFEATRYRK